MSLLCVFKICIYTENHLTVYALSLALLKSIYNDAISYIELQYLLSSLNQKKSLSDSSFMPKWLTHLFPKTNELKSTKEMFKSSIFIENVRSIWLICAKTHVVSLKVNIKIMWRCKFYTFTFLYLWTEHLYTFVLFKVRLASQHRKLNSYGLEGPEERNGGYSSTHSQETQLTVSTIDMIFFKCCLTSQCSN